MPGRTLSLMDSPEHGGPGFQVSGGPQENGLPIPHPARKDSYRHAESFQTQKRCPCSCHPCISQFRAIVHPLGTGVRIAWALARTQCGCSVPRIQPWRHAHICPGSFPLPPACPKCTPGPSRLLLQTASKCRTVAAALSPLTLCLLRPRKNN